MKAAILAAVVAALAFCGVAFAAPASKAPATRYACSVESGHARFCVKVEHGKATSRYACPAKLVDGRMKLSRACRRSVPKVDRDDQKTREAVDSGVIGSTGPPASKKHPRATLSPQAPLAACWRSAFSGADFVSTPLCHRSEVEARASVHRRGPPSCA